MAENALVDRDIRRGEAIVRALDEAADPAMHPTSPDVLDPAQPGISER
jgi:hypothetical protein